MTAQTDTSTAILIAAFNAEATIERAIASALAQPEVTQVIVIDDASQDATAAHAEAAAKADPRVTLLRQSVNAGPAAARNYGLTEVRAAWIGVLDSDDYFQQGRVGRLLAHSAEADFIADVLLRVAHEGDAAPTPAAWAADATRQIGLAEFLESNLGIPGRALDLGFVKPLMRRAFLEEHGLSYRDMRLGEDYELYARALALGAQFLLTPAAGYVSVEREGSLSKNHSERDLQNLRDCDEALAQIRALNTQERRALKRHHASVDRKLQWRLLINAVKARDPVAAIKTFRSPSAALYLAARLGEQVWLRSIGRAAAQ